MLWTYNVTTCRFLFKNIKDLSQIKGRGFYKVVGNRARDLEQRRLI
jgi:hypothetical protein